MDVGRIKLVSIGFDKKLSFRISGVTNLTDVTYEHMSRIVFLEGCSVQNARFRHVYAVARLRAKPVSRMRSLDPALHRIRPQTTSHIRLTKPNEEYPPAPNANYVCATHSTTLTCETSRPTKIMNQHQNDTTEAESVR